MLVHIFMNANLVSNGTNIFDKEEKKMLLKNSHNISPSVNFASNWLLISHSIQ